MNDRWVELSPPACIVMNGKVVTFTKLFRFADEARR